MRFALADTDSCAEIRSPSQGVGLWNLAGSKPNSLVQSTVFKDVDYFCILKWPSFNAGVEQLTAAVTQYAFSAKLNARWRKHVCSFHAPTDVDSLTETVDAVFDLVAEFGPASVSFSSMHASTVSGEHLAAALRALSMWRGEITGWDDAIAIAAASIAIRGEDPQDALYGLI